MKIGLDAKRAFFNKSGLGNYSRNVIRLLSEFYPNNEYILYTPSTKDAIDFERSGNISISTPATITSSISKSYWRSFQLTKQLQNENIEVYHGLSNELPNKINDTNIKSIITVHDLIFMRFPELYKHVDRNIYIKKVKTGCQSADKIIAISNQTKNDLVDFLNIEEEKIEVVYQGCNPIFYNKVDDIKKSEIKKKLSLPNNYILYVGTIEKRKNLLNIVKAIKEFNIDIELVAVGKKTDYYNEIANYISKNNLKDKIHFYHSIESIDLPAIYQMAELFVYPSIFEGFGIPIIEAINSKIPVITSQGSCFSEAGGESTIYIDPNNIEEIARSIIKVLSNNSLKDKMIENGIAFAQKFTDKKIAKDLMKIYLK